MNTIHVNIEDKRATVNGAPIIVCGNSGYKIQFTFDTEWDVQAAKTARFVYVQAGAVKYTDVVFEGDTVSVPVLSNTKEVQVGVFSGNLCTTTPARVPCKLSIRCGTGAPVEPTPDVYDQIMELLIAGGGGGGGGGGGTGTPYAVQYVAQSLSTTQQARARQNIGAVGQTEVNTAVEAGLATAKASGDFNGAPGEDGEDGEDGAPGSVWHTGTKVVSSGTPYASDDLDFNPNNGDYYLNTDTGDVFVATSDGYWDHKGNLKGAAGPAGPQGPAGPAGPAGADGAEYMPEWFSGSYSSETISFNRVSGAKKGDMYYSTTTGKLYQGGDTEFIYKVTIGGTGGGGESEPGADGRGISSARINTDGQLVLEYTDGETETVGKVVGSNGADGEDGKDGVSVTSVVASEVSTEDGGENKFTVNLSNGNSSTFTVRNGSKGTNGTNGTNGEDGARGFSILKVTTNPSAYTTVTGGFTPSYKISKSTVLTQSKATDVLVGDTLLCGAYIYPVGYVDSSTVYLGARTSIQGPKGDDGADGPDGADGKDGVGIKSVTQTTTSSADGGSNVITVTKTDNTTSTFTVKNGSKGSTGATGPAGTSVSITNVSESSVDGGANIVVFSDNKTLSIKNGKTGSQGPEGPQGPKGDSYTLTAADKAEIASTALSGVRKETWTFTLKDGSTVTKAVHVG